MWWWRCRWSVATTTTVFVLGIATVYSQLEISDLDKPSEFNYYLYLICVTADRPWAGVIFFPMSGNFYGIANGPGCPTKPKLHESLSVTRVA